MHLTILTESTKNVLNLVFWKLFPRLLQ